MPVKNSELKRWKQGAKGVVMNPFYARVRRWCKG